MALSFRLYYTLCYNFLLFDLNNNEFTSFFSRTLIKNCNSLFILLVFFYTFTLDLTLTLILNILIDKYINKNL